MRGQTTPRTRRRPSTSRSSLRVSRYARCGRLDTAPVASRFDQERLFWVGGLKRLLLNRSERRNGRDFLRFQLFRLLGLAIAVPVTSGHVFFHDGPVPINPTPTVDDNSAAAANKQRWRLPGFGRD
jgi:hypothetical protein